MGSKTLLRSLLGARFTALSVYYRLISIRHVWSELELGESLFHQRNAISAVNRQHLTQEEVVDRLIALLSVSHESVRAYALMKLLSSAHSAALIYERGTALLEAECRMARSGSILLSVFCNAARQRVEGLSVFLPWFLKLSRSPNTATILTSGRILEGIVESSVRRRNWTEEEAVTQLTEWSNALADNGFMVSRRWGSRLAIVPNGLTRHLRRMIALASRSPKGLEAIRNARDTMMLSMFQHPEHSESSLIKSVLGEIAKVVQD